MHYIIIINYILLYLKTIICVLQMNRPKRYKRYNEPNSKEEIPKQTIRNHELRRKVNMYFNILNQFI